MNRLVKKSFFKDFNVVTINNGIDLNLFKPTLDNTIKQKYNIPENKKIILGVASIWTNEKGLNDFVELSNLINDDFVIVLVGLSKNQIKSLKKYKNIIGIERTENQLELVKIYSAATWFLNLTYEDNYPTVNLESIACGTPVITYNTGGCSEQVNKETGFIVEVGNIEKVNKLINKNIELSNVKVNNNKINDIVDLYK